MKESLIAYLILIALVIFGGGVNKYYAYGHENYLQGINDGRYVLIQETVDTLCEKNKDIDHITFVPTDDSPDEAYFTIGCGDDNEHDSGTVTIDLKKLTIIKK